MSSSGVGSVHSRAGRSVDAPLQSGHVIAPGYEVIAHLHRSRHLDIYDVWSEEREARCAAKVARPDLLHDADIQHKLIREGSLLERFTHPHNVRAYETLTCPHPVLVLETLDGETLSYPLSRRRQRLPLLGVICLGLHLCSAIQYLHRQGYLHLDLKPSNIVADGGRAKVLDLSLARPPGHFCRGVGTDWYMAPEQACGAVLASRRVGDRYGALRSRDRAEPFLYWWRHRFFGRWRPLQAARTESRAYSYVPPRSTLICQRGRWMLGA